MDEEVALLTGGSGFIGSHLARRLLAAGASVHVVVRPSSSLYRLHDISDRLVIHRVELTDRDAVRECARVIMPSAVFHLAADTRMALSPTFELARNAARAFLEPTLNLLEALSELARPPAAFVRAGSIAEYGRAELPFLEDGPAVPLTPYAAGMLATSQYLAMLAPTLKFPIVTARLALCYGPGQSLDFLIAKLIDACIARRPTTLMHPQDRRDLLHVDDVVNALLRIAQRRGHECNVVNIGSGVAPTMEHVARSIAALTRCDPSLVRCTASAIAEPVELRCSFSRAREVFGWEPKIALEDGLEQTISVERQRRVMVG